MRTLLILRGLPGSGKSTWIEENGLKPYALCPDEIRLLCCSPLLQADGMECIGGNSENTVWKVFLQLIKERMRHGAFTVIDSTNIRTEELRRYKKLCGEYRYRVYCVDFTQVPLEEAKRRNGTREPLKRVPEPVIERMARSLSGQRIPSGIVVIRPDELERVWLKKIDLSGYRRIHHIGDLHGCYTVLREYLDGQGGIKEDEFYIFLGDYIDRGVENAEVVRFLSSIAERKNVLLLEGNHEASLWDWADGGEGRSKEFRLHTRRALERAGIDPKEMRCLYRKFGQCAYYRYGDRDFLVTHGGLSILPENLTLVATEQIMNGTGEYADADRTAETFVKTAPDSCYQIFGHRNPSGQPVRVNGRVYNLEGGVEKGGFLRCVLVDGEGIHPVEIRNSVWLTPELQERQAVEDAVILLRADPYVKEKRFGNISSFNFTKEAFREKGWNERTIQARGLYLDTAQNRVAARAYNKFFNIGERPETKWSALQQNLQFPVSCYGKENGFLGLVSWNAEKEALFITTKSEPEGIAAQWFRSLLHEKAGEDGIWRMEEYLKAHPVTLVFECVDMEQDPHIIEYPESRVILLDIVANRMEYEKYPYEKLCETARLLGFACKELACTLPDWQSFAAWYAKVNEKDYLYEGRRIEGFVIEDAAGRMVKLKLPYYKFWKQMRGLAEEIAQKGGIDRRHTRLDAEGEAFCRWATALYQKEGDKPEPWNICELRRRFLAEATGNKDRYS